MLRWIAAKRILLLQKKDAKNRKHMFCKKVLLKFATVLRILITLMRVQIQILPFNLMRIRILRLAYFQIWTLQFSKMTF
jgi:hypothetical protein